MNIQRWLEGLNFPNERKVCPEDSYRKILFWQCFQTGVTRVTLFDRRLETKRAALWKDISTRYSMFYKSRWVFALWRLESANWYRYYLSRCRYFSFVTFCRWMFESSSIKFLWHVNNKDSTRGNKVVFRRWCFRNTVIDD